MTERAHIHSEESLVGVVKHTDTAGGDLEGAYPDPEVRNDSHEHTHRTLKGVVKPGDAAGGDLEGTYPDPEVRNDSHTHSQDTLFGVVKNGDPAGGDLYGTYPNPRVGASAIGAPATADYLVGTAQGGLSAEIVVGTAPGGELGGTWASPTVDATHSGSAHHAAVTIGADGMHSLATQVLSGVAATASQTGHIRLTGELGGTATSPTVASSHSGSAHSAYAPLAGATFVGAVIHKGADIEMHDDADALTLLLTHDGSVVWGSGYDTNLYRGAANVLQTDDQMIAVDGFRMKTKAGTPSDADTTVDADGVIILDTTNHRLYIRDGGTWRYAALT